MHGWMISPGTPGYLLPLPQSPSRSDPACGISECASKRFILVGNLFLGWLNPLVGLGPRRQYDMGLGVGILIYVFGNFEILEQSLHISLR